MSTPSLATLTSSTSDMVQCGQWVCGEMYTNLNTKRVRLDNDNLFVSILMTKHLLHVTNSVLYPSVFMI